MKRKLSISLTFKRNFTDLLFPHNYYIKVIIYSAVHTRSFHHRNIKIYIGNKNILYQKNICLPGSTWRETRQFHILKAADQPVLLGCMLKVCRGLWVEMRCEISADLDLNTHGRVNARSSWCAWYCGSKWRGRRDRRSWTWKQGAGA